MKLIRTKCEKRCKGCTQAPLEINGDTVDLLIVDDYPKKEDIKREQPLSSTSGVAVRNMLAALQKKYDFGYAITYAYKNSKRDPTIDDISLCEPVVTSEITKLRPKAIVFLGKTVHNYFHRVNANIFLEEGRVSTVKVNGKSYPCISCVSPHRLVSIDPNCLGTIYNNMEKLLLATRGVSLDLPSENTTVYLDTVDAVKTVLSKLRRIAKPLGVDTETANLNRVYDNKILSVQFSIDGRTSYVIPLDHYESPFINGELKRVKKMLVKFFTGPTKITGYILHNAKFDMHQFFRDLHVLVYNAPIIDTSFNEYLLEENWTRIPFNMFPKGKGAYSLYTVAYKHNCTFYTESSDLGKDDRKSFVNEPIKRWVEYAGRDATILPNLYRIQLKRAKLQGYHRFKYMAVKFCTSLMTVLVYIENCGLPISIDKLRELYNPRTSSLHIAGTKLIQEMNTLPAVKKVTRKLKMNSTGYSGSLFGEVNLFDPNSRIHQELLFQDIMELESLNEDGKFSADKEFQKFYKSKHVEVDLFARYKRIQSLQTLQVNSIYEFMNKTSGKPDFYGDNSVRSSFFPTTVTGRLRSIEPNQQQRVSHGDGAETILEMYVSRPQRVFCKVDQSTFEVRGLAFISGDTGLRDNFIRMHEVKAKYRVNPRVYTSKSERLGVKTYRSLLFDGLDEQSTWDSATVDALLTSIPCVLTGNEDDDKGIHKKFCGYVRSVVATQSSWDVTELKQELTRLLKEEALRLIALIKVKNQTDIHKASAALFNTKDIHDVTSEERQNAKGLVFGQVYGRSIPSIANELGISLEDAELLAQKFSENMPVAFDWMEDCKKFGRANYYVESPLGRRRHLWGYFSPVKSILSKMDRLAVNTQVQGCCSDMNIIATANLIHKIKARGKLKYDVPIAQAWLIHNLVHDSAETEIPSGDIIEYAHTVEPTFTTELLEFLAIEYNVRIDTPIEIDMEFGLSYDAMTTWSGVDSELERLSTTLQRKVEIRDKED